MEIFKPLIALLAIVNPIGVIPFFIHFTGGFSREQRRRTIHVAAIGAFLVIAISALTAYSVTDDYTISVIAVALTYLAIGFPSSGAWVVFGSAMRKALHDPRIARAFNLTMAALLVASIAPIFWE